MPALKLLFRRTLATPAVNPSSILSSSLINGGTRRVNCLVGGGGGGGRRSTLATGACLGVLGAHVNRNIFLIGNNTSLNKTLCILSPPKYSSSSSSSSFEERESGEGGKVDSRVSDTSTASPSSSMGHKQNGVVDWGHRNPNQNGTVSSSPSRDQNEEQQQCTKLLTLPTVLTLARVAAIPVFIATFYAKSSWGTAATTSIFIAAAITDWLDGYLARKMRQGTAFGAFLDPVADKLMVAATLVLLCSAPPETGLLGDAPWLFPVPAIAIIGREITMSAVREWAASQNTKLLQAVAVNNLGKWKTATQMAALTILVATRDSSLAGSGTLVISGVGLLYISAGLAVWSLVVYMKKIWKVLLR